MDKATIKEARSILSDKGSSREDVRDARELLKMQKSVKSPKETISNLPLMPNDTSKIESLPLEEYKRAKGGRVASKTYKKAMGGSFATPMKPSRMPPRGGAGSSMMPEQMFSDVPPPPRGTDPFFGTSMQGIAPTRSLIGGAFGTSMQPQPPASPVIGGGRPVGVGGPSPQTTFPIRPTGAGGIVPQTVGVGDALPQEGGRRPFGVGGPSPLTMGRPSNLPPQAQFKKGGRVASKPRGVGVALRGFGKAMKGSK